MLSHVVNDDQLFLQVNLFLLKATDVLDLVAVCAAAAQSSACRIALEHLKWSSTIYLHDGVQRRLQIRLMAI